MESLNMDFEGRTYLRSESEFQHARMRAFIENVMAFMQGHNMHLLSFDEVVARLRLKQAIYRGLQDIPLDNIAGSTGRYEDFTRHFLPRTSDARDKERWRRVYTLAATGKGFPPIDAYKIDQVYFVKDGNHRTSVARELGWETIQAHVTEIPTAISLEPGIKPKELLLKEECAYFLECTELDKTRPDSKDLLNFTVAGGYHSLLSHIELHRQMLEAKHPGYPVTTKMAAVDWYDTVFKPMLNVVNAMMKRFPSRSSSDLYLWLVENQDALRRQHRLDELPESVAEFCQQLQEGVAVRG